MNALISNRKVLARIPYSWKPLDKGYSDQSLYVNLDTFSTEVRPVDPEVKEKFVGGKGYGLRMLWDAVTSQTKWSDPENEIVISGGPVCGITLVWNSGSNNYFNREAYTTLPGPKKMLIDGEVEEATEIKLSRFPLRTVTVKEAVYCPSGDSIAFKGAFRYDGYALCDILSTLKVDKASKEDFWPPVDIYIEVRNDQGDLAVFSWGEIFYSANPYGIVIAKRVTRVIPGKTGELWELPNQTQLVVESDLISERNIKSPSHITIKSLKGNYIVNRDSVVLENDPGRLALMSSLQDSLALITDLPQDLPLISHTTLFYGNSTGYKRVREFRGRQINRVLSPWFPSDDYRAIRCGMMSIAGVDGYRAAFSLAELINRNDHRDPLLVKEGNSFTLYAAGDAFADRCIKGLSEIRLVNPW